MKPLHSQMHSKTGKSAGDITDILAKQNTLSPEAQKVLEQKGELQKGEFETLLSKTKNQNTEEAVAELTTKMKKEGVKPEQESEIKSALNKDGKKSLKKVSVSQANMGNTKAEKLAQLNTNVDVKQASGHDTKINQLQQAKEGNSPLMVDSKEDVFSKVQVLPGIVATTQIIKNSKQNSPADKDLAKVLDFPKKAASKAEVQNVVNNTNKNISAENIVKPEKEYKSILIKPKDLIARAEQNAKATKAATPQLKESIIQNPIAVSKQAQQKIVSNQYAPKSNSMFKTNLDNKVSEAKPVTSSKTQMKDIMLGNTEKLNATGIETELPEHLTVQNTARPVALGATAGKVFEMQAAPDLANATSDEVITKIQDYIIQTQVGKEKQVEFSFRHQDLGQVDLQVQKTQNDGINILIGTNSAEGAKFFTQHQAELLQNLGQAGLNIAEFKMDHSSKSQSQDFSDQKQQFSQNSHKEHQSESGARKEEQEKRAQLWKDLAYEEAA